MFLCVSPYFVHFFPLTFCSFTLQLLDLSFTVPTFLLPFIPRVFQYLSHRSSLYIASSFIFSFHSSIYFNYFRLTPQFLLFYTTFLRILFLFSYPLSRLPLALYFLYKSTFYFPLLGFSSSPSPSLYLSLSASFLVFPLSTVGRSERSVYFTGLGGNL